MDEYYPNVEPKPADLRMQKKHKTKQNTNLHLDGSDLRLKFTGLTYNSSECFFRSQCPIFRIIM